MSRKTTLFAVMCTLLTLAFGALAPARSRADIDLAAVSVRAIVQSNGWRLLSATVQNVDSWPLWWGNRHATVIMQGWDWVWHDEGELSHWSWDLVHQHNVITTDINTLFAGYTAEVGFYMNRSPAEPWAYGFLWARYILQLDAGDRNRSNDVAISDWVYKYY